MCMTAAEPTTTMNLSGNELEINFKIRSMVIHIKHEVSYAMTIFLVS